MNFLFYTYPDFEQKYMKIGLAINDNKWGINVIDTDADLANIQGIYIVKGSNLDTFFSNMMSVDYQDKILIKTLKVNDLTLMEWTSYSEKFWLWRF